MTDITNFHYFRDKDGKLKQLDLTTGEETFAELPSTVIGRFKYTKEIASIILQHIREGKTVTKIALMDGMPNASMVYSWARKHPDFGDAMKAAREDRAEHFHDKVIEQADDLTAKEDVPIMKAKTDAYKWAAEKGNPQRYGKMKEDGGVGNVTIIVDTGIPKPITVETECQTIQTEEDTQTQSETCSSTPLKSAGEEETEPESILE